MIVKICSRGWRQPGGGARRDRTADLLLAKQALSQLSYGPLACPDERNSVDLPALAANLEKMVGLGRFELPTSPLSGVRSNQLSYRPGADTDRSQRRTSSSSLSRTK
jgi:hypothetical protein